jgi:hypothetical protein
VVKIFEVFEDFERGFGERSVEEGSLESAEEKCYFEARIGGGMWKNG